MKHLLFIDTNVYLDFYRNRSEATLKLLAHLDNLHERIITSYQVEMEFKKNRQKVILESLKSLKSPDRVLPPAFLAEAKSTQVLQKDLEKAKKRIGKLQNRLKKVLLNPTTQDPVYKTVQRIFMDNTDYNLTRADNVRFSIRRLAWKRFILGYPPRKKGDTSTGDAINWEWLIHCANRSTNDIIIVSRDSDYGVTHENEFYVNDWLRQEFKKRVSKKRNVILTDRLSHALKLMDVRITAEEEAVEENRASRESAESALEFFKQIIAQSNPTIDASTKALLQVLAPSTSVPVQELDDF